MKRVSRATVLKRHAKTRASERMQLELSNAQLRAIVKTIQDNKAVFVYRRSLARTIWDVEFEGRTLRVSYDSNRKAIVTFLYSKEKTDV